MIHYIDADKCTGCGQCFKTCSLDVFRLDTDQNSLSPCMAACPAGNDIRGINHLVQRGRLTEALDRFKQTNPFPAMTGRVCFHPCEQECSRAKVDESVNINGIEQYLGDIDLKRDCKAFPVKHLAKVAVIGSGPAGLSSAWFLTQKGYHVTVFEALPEPGGMLRYGIPAYRLPDDIVRRQIELMEHAGVEFRCGVRVGDAAGITVDEIWQSGYSAIVLAPGFSVGRKLGLEGEDLPGILSGVEFLRSVRRGERPDLGKSCVVVGGGNVAIDAAISARRLGVEIVHLCCLEEESVMPAFRHNVLDAKEEGVLLHDAFGPQKILSDDNEFRGVVFHRCLRLYDENHAWAPLFDTDQTMELTADSMILAIGQAGDFSGLGAEVKRGRIVTSDGMTVSENVYAAGDAVHGAASVIAAIAAGRKVAEATERRLKGRLDAAEEAAPRPIVSEMPYDSVPRIPRNERRAVSSEGFEEKTAGFGRDEVFAEAMRCMTCGSKSRIAYDDDCMTCYSCELRCPANAITVHPFKERLPYTLYPEHGGKR